jgi:hypothetical protein
MGFGSAVPVWSTSLVPLNLPDMVGHADRIVVARAVDEWTGRDQHGIPATITTFEVSRSLMGGPLQTLRVKQVGVTEIQPDGLVAWVEGMPRYIKGTEYLLLLGGDSALGFTSPVGLMQGAFELRPAATGGKVALNGVDNANLFLGVDAATLTRIGITPEHFPFVGRGRGGVQLDELVQLIERLTSAR